MNVRNGRGRPPYPDVLTPAEWRVLEHVRAGRTNAEIAEQLRLSPNTVRYHVSNMLSKLHVESRDALAQWGGRPRRVPVLAWLLGAGGWAAASAVVVLVAVAVAAALAITRAPGEPEPAAAAAGSAPAPAATSAFAPPPFPQTAEYRAFTPEELSAAGFVDTGAVFHIAGNPFPLVETSYRGGFSSVRAARDGYVSPASGSPWAAGRPPEGAILMMANLGLAADIDGRRLFLRISAATGRMGTVGSPTTAPFYSIDGDTPPEMLVQVIDADRVEHPVIVDRSGHLWLRSEPLGAGVVAYDTGEHLDVSDAAALGPLTEGIGNWTNDTMCEGGVCFAIFHESAGLRAVADGVLTCVATDEDLRLVLETPRYHLLYEATRGVRTPTAECGDSAPRDVTAGDLLTQHPSWHLSATTPDGAPLSVAIDRDRMMYVGELEVAVTECGPCRPRWQ